MTLAKVRDRNAVLALCGGIGGAKLALGLSRILPATDLVFAVNTGDDFEHLGLHISPDIDTLTYVLAGLDNEETGWGRREETWSFMAALGQLGGENWFRLGDRDLAIHVERTRRLRAGDKLSTVTQALARALGVADTILPMSDEPVRTRVMTMNGAMDFQRYFVEAQCAPIVTGFAFEGAKSARPHPDILAALRNPSLRAIIICPSNPYISIDPILSLPDLRSAISSSDAPVIAVSPIIGGRAVKGPTAKMMRELGLSVDVMSIARHYRDVIDGLVIDPADADWGPRLGLPVAVEPSLMRDLADRERLARATLAFADRLGRAAVRDGA